TSAVVVPVPSSKPQAPTRPATTLDTVTVTAAEVVVLPAASRATAVSVWLPVGTVVVFPGTEEGEAGSSAPRLAPSSLNWTPTTPTLSEALADTVIVPDTVAPAVGLVRLTVGAVVSAVTTALAWDEGALTLPDASAASTR